MYQIVHKNLSRMAQYVLYRSKTVSSEDSTVTLNIADVMAVDVGESTVNVSVYWRVFQL